MQQEPPLNVPTFTKINCPNSGPRSSHSSVLYKNHLITFGGWNAKGIGDVVILDLEKGTWTQMYPTGLSSRYGHTMSLYKQNEIIVYGGRDSKVIKDLGILTVEKENPFSLKWQLIQTTANTPFRARHSAHIYEDKMYIVGGIDKGKKSVNDVWCLSLAGHTWNKVQTTGFQQERSSHGSVLLDGRIYVFGGIVTKNTERLNDMQMLTLSTMSWQTIQTKGTIPYPMYGSSMLEESGKLYLFGGYKADGNCSNDLFIYNLGTFTWKTLQTTGDIPGPRCYQTMTWYQKKIIIWAGWREKNLYSDIFTLTLNNNTNTNDEEEKEEEKKNDNDSKTQVDLEDNDESKMKLCIVCEAQPSDMVFLDCMHVCTCRECSKKVSSSTNKCPICREDIRDIRKVFLT